MKKLIIISTLSILSFSAIATDSCQMLSAQEQRLNSCQVDLAKTQTDISNLNAGIDDVQRKLSPRAKQKRAQLLASCETQNTQLASKIQSIKKTNQSASKAISTLSAHKQDIAKRVSGNKLIEGFECVTIDHKLGNGIANHNWGGFAGKQAIFIGEGVTQAQAQQAMIQDAARKQYFTKDASDRRKRIIKNMQCLAIYAKAKAVRVLSAVNGIITEANKVVMPALANAGSRGSDNSGNRDSRRNRTRRN